MMSVNQRSLIDLEVAAIIASETADSHGQGKFGMTKRLEFSSADNA